MPLSNAEKSARWRAKHPERAVIVRHRYYHNNKEKESLRRKKYYILLLEWKRLLSINV